MKRSIALARDLSFHCLHCDLLLLDEAFQGLDRTLKNNLSELVIQQALNITVVMVSHDTLELSELAANRGKPEPSARRLRAIS